MDALMEAKEVTDNKVTSQFEKDLTALINKHSMENMSDTPDYILAAYLMDCLKSFSKATIRRDQHKL